MSMTYDVIYRGRNKPRNKSSHGRNGSSSNNKRCKYFGKMHSKGNTLPMEKSARNVAGTTTSNLSVEVVVMINMT